MPLTDRFWSRVTKGEGDACWIWHGGRCSDGRYGAFRVGKTMKGAHVFAWEEVNGPVLPGKQVLHQCDVMLCVRPGHLFLGTAQENVADMDAKGRRRAARGAESHQAKLSVAQVQEARALYAAGGISQAELGKRYGVEQTTMGAILRGKTYRAAPSSSV